VSGGFVGFEGFGACRLRVLPNTRINTRSVFSLVFKAFSPFLRELRVFSLSVV
jgi:hypothetical protein